jgi:two-component system, NtrC family, nitrogen regulation response regulator NtrX
MAHDILIVDDEADIRMLIGGILEDDGHQTRGAADSTAALEAIHTRRPTLVILDIWLQGSKMDGLELLDVIKREHPSLPVVVISGHGNIETAVAAIKRGAYDFIEKPFKADRLVLVVERAIEAARLRRENEELRIRAGDPSELVGGSSAMNAVRQAVERVAPTGSRVLITGLAGAGKEVVARQIHAHSRRADGPFIILNCASMRPDRMEVELFGAEAGVPGPDSPSKIGTFEQAHGGTLLLDEVADMPLETQGKIVRVLQEQTFERVGGRARVSVDVRVIASSNRDLAAEIAAGRFREDLYYRLNVVPIRVPALRERRDDVPELARYFMTRAAGAAGMVPRSFGEDAMAALQAYEWPGNVRQLRNVVERTIILTPRDRLGRIEAEMLPSEIVASRLTGDSQMASLMGVPLREARESFEREYLRVQIRRFSGNISKTASFIGMERSALHRKLKLLGMVDRAEEAEDA